MWGNIRRRTEIGTFLSFENVGINYDPKTKFIATGKRLSNTVSI